LSRKTEGAARSLAVAAVFAVALAPGLARAAPAPDAVYDALEKHVAAAPARGDLDAIVDAVGKDPKALAAWVRDNVRWEPYDGVLRGAEGTAAARGGNAVDQALLLQALLERAGVKGAKVMTRRRSGAERKAMLKAFLKADGRALLADVERVGADALGGLVSGDAKKAAEVASKADASAVDEAVAAAEKVAPGLAAALKSTLRARRVDAPASHYWVEVAGEALDPVDATAKHDGGEALDERALAALRHTLVVTLVMKRKLDGKAGEETLLQVPVALDEALLEPIQLEIRPDPDKLGITPAAARKDPKKLLARLMGKPVLRGSLLVGGQRHGAAAFDAKGTRYEVGGDGEAGSPAQLGAALAGGFGGFGGFGGGGKKKEPKVELESIVLRVEVRGPSERDNPERVHERVLLTGEAAELPVVRVSLLAENQDLAPGERELSAARTLLANRDAIKALVAGDKGVDRAIAAPSEPAPTLLRYADLRRQVQARLVAGQPAQHFRERTGLVALVERLSAEGDEIRIQQRFDILANPVAFTAADGRLDAARAVALGVADTALEAALLGAKKDRVAAGTAWDQLSATKGQPKTTRAGGVVRVAWGDGAWWSVDPKSGNVVGRVTGGGGQAMVEYAKKVSDTVCNWGWVLSIYAAAHPNNDYYSGDADKWVGRFCSVLSGTEMQQYQSEQISEITNNLWQVAIPALIGLRASE